ncbi:DNA topology modulation protein FlaR [Eubacterium sp. 1001713B170207_170306_E7]|uniref:DNA topology modulation protein FlaR n=1 Tax=Eubacterium sp. 1001713B170207_170306_E7 TaxID=2787097 RepID=UPI0018981126|nr:DNA topology modulation protein FlaR [Eubacterium sp. 1001713B170207_170306_E7]
MKIAVIGYSGAGKSTLAKKLGEALDCPVLHLDKVNFLPGWQERDRDEAREMVASFMAQDSWIIDGNYGELHLDRRMAEADKIIMLCLPRRVCFPRAYMRYRSSKNQVRDSMADGCEEKFDYVFARWILKDGRSKRHRNWYRGLQEKDPRRVYLCRSHRDVKNLLENWK